MSLECLFADLSNDVVAGIAGGVAAWVISALILCGSNLCRMRRIHRSITKSLQPDNSVARTRRSILLNLENDTLIPVIVRSVEIRGGEIGAFTVSLTLHDHSLKEGVVTNARGWVEMPEKTDATWCLNFESDDADSLKQCFPVESVVAEVAYKTILGSTRIIEIQAKSQLDWIKKAFQENLTSIDG